MAESAILEGLNPAQYEAVTHEGGPLLIVAGAGSGKTRVITRRIAYLIDHHDVSPFEILAITFTNKAAGEMRERVGALVGPVVESMWVSTFHKACVQFLRRDAEYVGYPKGFTIYDQSDAVRLCGYVMRDLNLDTKRYPARSVHAAISNAKNNNITAAEFADCATGPHEKRVASVFEVYQQRLVTAAAMDFDDLLQRTVELFRSHPEVLDRWRNRFRHLFVDEYQDTNPVQNELCLKLARTGANAGDPEDGRVASAPSDDGWRTVTVVGDPNQSIYAFRGADIRNILEFENAFSDVRIVLLGQNYRSPRDYILNAANDVISHNASRYPLELESDAGNSCKVVKYVADDEVDEAQYVASEMVRRHDDDQMRWDEMAVFYRTNVQSRAIEEKLVAANVPYVLVGGTRFYDRREVRDAMAYLKVIANPADELSVRRALVVPKRGVGDRSIEKIDGLASELGASFFEALSLCDEAGVSNRVSSGIRGFVQLIEDVSAMGASPAATLQELLERSGYLDELRGEETVEAAGRLENLAELVGSAGEHETLDEFLDAVALVADTDDIDETAPAVTLMTVHSAKGLEYHDVYIVGLEDGVFPHFRALTEPAEMEEERRLAYVGITRAMTRLTLTHASSRWLHGTRQYNPQSTFLKEIRKENLEVVLSRRLRRSRYRAGFASGYGSSQTLDERLPGAGSRTPRVRTSDSGGRAVERRSATRDEIVERALEAGRQAVAAPGADRLGFRVGDDVRHSQWGEGVIVDIDWTGSEPEASVHFAAVGEKQLLLSWAPLQKI